MKHMRQFRVTLALLLVGGIAAPARGADDVGQLALWPAQGTAEYTFRGEMGTPQGPVRVDVRVSFAAEADGGYGFILVQNGGTSHHFRVSEAGALTDGDHRTIDPETPDAQAASSIAAVTNALLCIARSVSRTPPSAPPPGCTTMLPLPDGETATLPLAVSRAATGGTPPFALTAAGRSEATLRMHRQNVRATIAIGATAGFRDGRLFSATATRSVQLRVFVRTMTLDDTWSIAR